MTQMSITALCLLTELFAIQKALQVRLKQHCVSMNTKVHSKESIILPITFPKFSSFIN